MFYNYKKLYTEFKIWDVMHLVKAITMLRYGYILSQIMLYEFHVFMVAGFFTLKNLDTYMVHIDSNILRIYVPGIFVKGPH